MSSNAAAHDASSGSAKRKRPAATSDGRADPSPGAQKSADKSPVSTEDADVIVEGPLQSCWRRGAAAAALGGRRSDSSGPAVHSGVFAQRNLGREVGEGSKTPDTPSELQSPSGGTSPTHPTPSDDPVTRAESTAGPPRKQSRGAQPQMEAAIAQQALLEKLNAKYGPYEAEHEEDDDGDVSGEDAFGEDEADEPGMSALGGYSLSTTRFGGGGGLDPYDRDVDPYSDRKPPPPPVLDSYQMRSSGTTAANRELGAQSYSQMDEPKDIDASNSRRWASSLKSPCNASESSLDVLARLQSEAARKPPPGERLYPPAAAHRGINTSSIGNALGVGATKPPPREAFTGKNDRALGGYSESEAQRMQKGSFDQMLSPRLVSNRDEASQESSILSNGSSLASGPPHLNVAASRDTAMRAGGKRAGDNVRDPRRDVIAGIEAEMMRLEAESETEDDRDGNSKIRARKSNNPFEPVGNRTLTDQISHMAIDPPRPPADDDSSANSIHSWDSFDGKCTNIYATRARTLAEELACHALNKAICDLYEAPVKTILRQFPGVTRLVRADDNTGNVQLHHAVRNGNVKALRRIVRSDPGCALIRDFQGYCPLHTAVHIGNFAAVHLLCSLAPASAKVQCVEGCLPLHEAVSNAAHLPDAPQITAALINAFPSAIKITNDEGLLPLHLAAMSGFGAGIRTIFAYDFSTIYARENTEEMLPLDFAIDGYRAAVEQVENGGEDRRMMASFRNCVDILLMSALYDRPMFTQARDEQPGVFLPIHGAAAAQPCSQSWKQIVSMYGSNYASDVDVRGRTALHVLASSAPYRLDVVAEMIADINQLDPTSATTFDGSGLIPLHAALMHRQTHVVVECLAKSNLSTVGAEVGENAEYRGMLPFQLAAASGCDLDVVNLLLRAHPIGVAGALPKK